MKKVNNKNVEVKKTEKKYTDKGRIFVKVMAGALCFMMAFSAVASLIFALI